MLSGCTDEKREKFKDPEMPSVYIATPHPYPFISRGFCISLRNLFIPFPDHHFETVQGRNIPDARNVAIYNAMANGFDYIMMIDADQYFPWDFFIELYGGIKEYGPDTIVTGWSVCKTGLFAGKTSVYTQNEHSVDAIPSVELQTSERYREVDAFGTAGFLAPTKVFEKVEPPYFTDINIICGDKRPDGTYPTEFAMGQDIYSTDRFRQAGVKIVCATDMRMPHETVSYM